MNKDLEYEEMVNELTAMIASMTYEDVAKCFNFCADKTEQPMIEPVYLSEDSISPVWRKVE